MNISEMEVTRSGVIKNGIPTDLRDKQNYYVRTRGEDPGGIVVQKVTVSIPLDLVDVLKREAIKSHRSLSTHVTEILSKRKEKKMEDNVKFKFLTPKGKGEEDVLRTAPAVEEEMRQRFNRGGTMQQISSDLNVPYHIVRNELIQSGLHFPKKIKKKRRKKGRNVNQAERSQENHETLVGFAKALPTGKQFVVREAEIFILKHFDKMGRLHVPFAKTDETCRQVHAVTEADPHKYGGVLRRGDARGEYYWEPELNNTEGHFKSIPGIMTVAQRFQDIESRICELKKMILGSAQNHQGG